MPGRLNWRQPKPSWTHTFASQSSRCALQGLVYTVQTLQHRRSQMASVVGQVYKNVGLSTLQRTSTHFSIKHHILSIFISHLHLILIPSLEIPQSFRMRAALLISALAGLAAAAPRPQDTDIDAVLVSPLAYMIIHHGLTSCKERASTQQDRTSSGGAQRPGRLQPTSRCGFSLCRSHR